MVNQKKYEIFEQEVQYKENNIKIIDQEKKLKAQSEEFFDNAERILQQDETLKQLEFKIEDVEKLIDDVTDVVYQRWLGYVGKMFIWMRIILKLITIWCTTREIKASAIFQ